MSYTKTVWENSPSTNTPINKDNLNHMEEGIHNAHEEVAKKMDSENPVGTGSFSMNRKKDTNVGTYSHAEGIGAEASGVSSHAEGSNTTASGARSHAEGAYTAASGANSHAEGSDNTTASGISSHAEGANTKAQGQSSHAEGSNTTASGDNAHAEGYYTTASKCAHAEGSYTVANGEASHAEGSGTTASGKYSHVEGLNSKASGLQSHAEGLGTIASGNAQHVQGKYNVEDTEGIYTHIVGGGTSISDRKNIHTIDLQGNAVFAGDVTNGNGVSLNGLKELVESVQNPTQEYSLVDDTGNNIELSIDPINYIMTLTLKNSKGVTLSEKTIDFPIESMVVGAAYESGDLILTLQNGQTLNVDISTIVSGLVKDSITIAGLNLKDDITMEELSTALDLGNKANKNNLEYAGSLKGNGATVSEDYKSVSMGEYNTSIGRASFASGGDNNVSGNYATAQGYNCYVSGGYASAAGRYLLASSIDQRVEGRYNAEDTQNQYAYILGNGKSASSRSNAYTVDWNGNAAYSGNLIAANFKGIAKNFTAEDENMAAAAPLVKQLYEENQSLKARIDKIQNQLSARFDVPAKSSITLHMPNQHNLVLFYTHMVIPTYKSITFASAGNGNNTNAGQRASLFRIVESQFVTYEVSNVSGYYNDVIITNSGDYTIYVMCTSFGGTLPTLVN